MLSTMIGKLNILLFFLLLYMHESLKRFKNLATLLPNNCLASRFTLMRLGKQLAERERISEII